MCVLRIRITLQLPTIIASFGAVSYGKMGALKKKKKKRFTAVEMVKAMARAQIGTPPTSKIVPDRKKKESEKHKKTLGRLLGEE
jgi:hypothetical protein